MRILHIATRHRRGGAERNLQHTVEWEAAHGHEVELAFGEVLDSDGFQGLPVHCIAGLRRSPSPIDDARTVHSIRALVRRRRYDIVHTHQSKAGILGRRAARGEVRALLHTVHMPSFGPGYGALPSVLFTFAERYCARFTDEYIAVGAELRRMYLDAGIGSPSRFSVIRSPIDVDRYLAQRNMPTVARRAARDGLVMGDRTRVALVVSSLERRKRVDLIIERLAPYLASYDLMLLVAGDGSELGSLRTLVHRLGVGDRVRLLGHVADIESAYAAADVFVHASQVEGVSQAVVQALAAGLPVVATRAEGLDEVEGARVLVAARDGRDLWALLAAGLDRPPLAAPADSFESWGRPAIECQLEELHARLERTLGTELHGSLRRPGAPSGRPDATSDHLGHRMRL